MTQVTLIKELLNTRFYDPQKDLVVTVTAVDGNDPNNVIVYSHLTQTAWAMPAREVQALIQTGQTLTFQGKVFERAHILANVQTAIYQMQSDLGGAAYNVLVSLPRDQANALEEFVWEVLKANDGFADHFSGNDLVFKVQEMEDYRLGLALALVFKSFSNTDWREFLTHFLYINKERR